MVTRCVMKNDKKEKIWDLFDQKENANDIQTMILEYENEFSDDMDIFLMKMCLFIYENKIQAAIEIGKQALRKNPYLLEIHLKLAEAYKDQSKYIELLYIQIISVICRRRENMQRLRIISKRFVRTVGRTNHLFT